MKGKVIRLENTPVKVSRKDALELKDKVINAIGADKELDQHIARALSMQAMEFTAAIEDAKSIVEYLFPDAHIHLGYGVTGIFPCATLSIADRRYTSEAPTVPIAILRVSFTALAE
jgi:hypothetical protein